MQYTMRQMQVFVDEIGRRKRWELREWAIAIRQTQGSEPKPWMQYLESLEEDD